jgi:hypothetical protein
MIKVPVVAKLLFYIIGTPQVIIPSIEALPSRSRRKRKSIWLSRAPSPGHPTTLGEDSTTWRAL